MPLDLKRLSPGQRVQDPFLVLEIDQRDSARGSFTTLTLGNCRGRLPTAPFWPGDQARIAGIAVGDVVQVRAELDCIGAHASSGWTAWNLCPGHA